MNDNGKNLLEKITDLDPELITGAEKKPRRISNLFIGITSGMATLAAAALIAVAINHNLPTKPPIVDTNSSAPSSGESSDSATDSNNSSTSTSQEPASDPPQLDFSEYSYLPVISFKGRVTLGGKGGGTLESLYSSELEISSPWNGADLKTMPVYMSGSTETPDLDRMYARVKEIAAVLGIPENSLTITDSYEDLTSSIEQQRKLAKEAGATPEEIEALVDRMLRYMNSMTYVEAETEGISIHLNSAYAAQILFSDPVELPEVYNFTSNATTAERDEALSYLAEKYKELTGYADPMPGQSRFYGDYVYEADGELKEQIVNYWINTTHFSFTESSDNLDVIWIYSDSALEKLDDYPILTAGQAEAMLKSNKYDDDNRMPADAKILKTEMVYYNMAGSTAVMPYYEFYVATDIEPDGNYDVICEVYSIAAVPEEFIDMETTDYGVRA
ncbi:MAG: hypothetical protein J1F28_08095 [Oscillospiraceae bacterium]|nr:hypothetical protein [Oscillospiraceae bacterium]